MWLELSGHREEPVVNGCCFSWHSEAVSQCFSADLRLITSCARIFGTVLTVITVLWKSTPVKTAVCYCEYFQSTEVIALLQTHWKHVWSVSWALTKKKKKSIPLAERLSSLKRFVTQNTHTHIENPFCSLGSKSCCFWMVQLNTRFFFKCYSMALAYQFVCFQVL